MMKDTIRYTGKLTVFQRCSLRLQRHCLIFLLCLLPLLQSCSSNFAYNNLDWLIHWYVDDYVELSAKQKQDFDQYFNELQQWHRNNELGRYLVFLTTIRHSLTEEKPTDQSLARAITEKSKESYQFWLDLISAADVPLGQLAMTLSEEQKNQLILAVQRQMLELDEKAARNDRPAERRKKLIKAITPWLGELSRKQQTLVRQWAGKMAPTRTVLKEYRQRWTVGLENALHAPTEQIPASLNRVLVSHESWQSTAYRDTVAGNRRLTEKLIADLLGSRSRAQNRTLLEELNRWINRLEQMKKT